MEEVNLVSSLLEELFSVEEIDIKGADYPYQYFGYESVHFLIGIPEDLMGTDFSPIMTPSRVCEVQVRTILQEAWAEVEHELIYKSDFSPLDEPLKRKLAALNANLTLSDIMFQEIRDYQKSLHTELRKRRKGFYDTIRRNQKSSDDSQTGKGIDAISKGSTETVDSLLLKGLLAHNEQDYLSAIEIYTVILSKSSRKDIRTVIFLHRGMAYFSHGKETEALADFNSALDLDPNNTKALYYRAVNARMNGEYLKAFSDLAVCLEKDPYNLEYLTARGEIHISAGNKEAAREDFQAALSIEPDFKPALRLLEELDHEDI